MKDDLELLDIEQFTGTEGYHNVLGANVTDGIAYIISNGYSWFVTDMLAVLRIKLKDEDFCAVKLKIKDHKAVATIDDGNGKVLYTQKYDYTDAKVDLTLFYTNSVLMLSKEY